ncbi:MAG: hypothetical protein ACHQYQ_00320 [Bacteriovoracales bacterium]
MKKLNLLGLTLISFTAFANYQNPSLKEFLSEFQKDPKRVMNQKPFKSVQNKELSAFDITKKFEIRKRLFDNARNKEEMFGVNSINKLFFDYTDILTNAFEIDEKPLKTVKLIEEPWSGYFWSMSRGLLGNRYADRKFNREHSWEDRFEYVTENPASDEDDIDSLSPSEKYELLIGNKNGNLTSFMWEEGKKEIAKYKKIRDLSGLCHGLAMASMKYPWPQIAIKVKSADGKYRIKFYPEDIKALGIFLWSGDNIPSRRLGGRCELPSPSTDSIGRIKNPDCRDPNPGAFHLALINRLGLQKKSLIMDSATDAEVWNYPIVGYKFTFFNPETSKQSSKIKNTMIRLADFKNDKFSQFRSPGTEYIVGVETKVDYLTHGDPEQEDKDSRRDAKSIYAIYRYDLELDVNGRIIGGEWYSNRNPDFLWFPGDNADPKATFDYLIQSSWNPSKTSLPADWIESANSSAEQGQVSSNIIKALFEYSNKASN